MRKDRNAVFASAMLSAALICGAGAAKAQGYGDGYYGPAYDDHSYADRPETVIVHPYYDQVEQQQLAGRIDGEVNPVALSIARPVDFSDLNLSRHDDYLELRARIYDTARNLCGELDARYPDLRGDRDADRECVRRAADNAMRDVFDPYG